jgi:hypothetical protein
MGMKKQELATKKRSRQNSTQKNNNVPNDPRIAHKDEQVTNTEQQNEIVNEPNYKTDREEENSSQVPEAPDNLNQQDPAIIKKEQPNAEA